MESNNTHDVAGRLGFAIGMGTRFFLNDRNRTLRWIKRSFFFVLVAVLFAQVMAWLASALLSLGCAALVIWALTKSHTTDILESCSPPNIDNEQESTVGVLEGMWRDGPEGWGYYRADDIRLDF